MDGYLVLGNFDTGWEPLRLFAARSDAEAFAGEVSDRGVEAGVLAFRDGAPQPFAGHWNALTDGSGRLVDFVRVGDGEDPP